MGLVEDFSMSVIDNMLIFHFSMEQKSLLLDVRFPGFYVGDTFSVSSNDPKQHFCKLNRSPKQFLAGQQHSCELQGKKIWNPSIRA